MPAIARYRFGLVPQCSVTEWARHLAGLEDANSAEFAPNGNISNQPLPEQQDVVDLRDDAPSCILVALPPLLAFKLYQERWFTNGTGIATSSTMPIATCFRNRLRDYWHFSDAWWKLSNCPTPIFHCYNSIQSFISPQRPHPLFKGFVQAVMARSDQGSGSGVRGQEEVQVS